MRILFIFALLVVLAYAATAQPQGSRRRCPVGSSWRSCGRACPRTCANRRPTCPGWRCRAGCFCNRGWIRRSVNGPCIREHLCPRT